MRSNDVKRDQIVSAAGRVFARHGVEKTTVTDIVKEAGVGRATFYKSFSGKEDVFRSVLSAEIGEVLESVRRASAEASGARARLKAAAIAYTTLMRERLNLYRVTVDMVVEMVPLAAWHGEISHLIEGFGAIYESILEDGVRAGEIEVPDRRGAARILLLVFKGIFLGSITGETGDRGEIVGRTVDMLMDGLRPREADA